MPAMFILTRDPDLSPFYPKINGFPGLIVELLCEKFADTSCVLKNWRTFVTTFYRNAFADSNEHMWISAEMIEFSSAVLFKRKGKERKSIYIAPFVCCVYLKALRHGSHSFTCKYTMPAFPL